MASLFPSSPILPEASEFAVRTIGFGRSWKFDYAVGEFVTTPTGKVAESRGVEAWLEWCNKALSTARYRYLAYTRNYGQEFDDLIAKGLNRSGNESEIKRIATECLTVDPRTASVSNFQFDWQGETCMFTCEVRNIHGTTGTLTGSVVTK
ncbi:Protein of unknown function [Paenibacillus tianmuensis]|uniref:DUF2634 domain-containing protein n=1 Tax=Paenibacillus tianmuensis TaxID=624147 RepID=A0A1G4QI05_9BACL|nr:DUF2634 domain-containing protein [Paenibacillus tianmuensis]SCW43968.1 Protein of unknown function [Paenibacillus tianmuensis]